MPIREPWAGDCSFSLSDGCVPTNSRFGVGLESIPGIKHHEPNRIALLSYIRYSLSMPVLKLKTPDEAKELEFELDYLARLTTRERFQMMLAKSRQMARLLQRNGRRRTTQIVKRT